MPHWVSLCHTGAYRLQNVLSLEDLNQVPEAKSKILERLGFTSGIQRTEFHGLPVDDASKRFSFSCIASEHPALDFE